MADNDYAFTPASGWCFLLLDNQQKYSAGFRIVGWRSNSEGEVVGMVPVTPPVTYRQGQPLALAAVPPVPGHYRHWDDLSPELQQLIAKG